MGPNKDGAQPINTRYKDSVFSLLFHDAEKLRELYSALSGVDVPPDTAIEITTLNDVLYMAQLNDLSFTLGGKLVVLIEHQSTINPNMPLRLLLYTARTYEKIINRRKLYQKGHEKIPSPEFIVLYNGKEPLPDFSELRLSDAFIDASEYKSGLHPRGCEHPEHSLELVAKVYNGLVRQPGWLSNKSCIFSAYGLQKCVFKRKLFGNWRFPNNSNINEGCNADILERSETLKGYSQFVGRVRELEASLPREEAMKAGIKRCMELGVLKGFLEKHSSEVFNMLITEWDDAEARLAWYEEGIEDGIEKGIAEGSEERAEKIALAALAKGLSPEIVQEITGLDMEVIRSLEARV